MYKRKMLIAAVSSFTMAFIILGFGIKANADTEPETFQEEFSRVYSPEIAFQAKADGSWTTWNKFWFATAIGGQLTDAMTTSAAVADGCVEANPLYGEHPDDIVVMGIKSLVIGLAYVVTEYWVPVDKRQNSRNIAYGTLGVLGFAAAGWNSQQDCY